MQNVFKNAVNIFGLIENGKNCIFLMQSAKSKMFWKMCIKKKEEITK